MINSNCIFRSFYNALEYVNNCKYLTSDVRQYILYGEIRYTGGILSGLLMSGAIDFKTWDEYTSVILMITLEISDIV